MSVHETAEAKLASAEDLPSVVEMDHSEVILKKSGLWRMEREVRLRVNNDHGRDSESVQVIPFNDRSSRLKILEAYTLTDGKKVDVARQNIEYKEVGESKAFDVQKQVTVSFPNVNVGSKIYLKYRVEVREIPFPGFWSTAGAFYNDFVDDYQVKIDSELPLHVWKRDPSGILSIERKPRKTGEVLEIRSVKPIHLAVTQEDYPFARAERGTLYTVSTLNDWNQHARLLLAGLERLLREKLPPSLVKIRDEANAEKTPLAKLNRVAAGLAQDFRYFGDWRRRNGGYEPRSLTEIDHTRYGDCKDLSLAAVAIYRALGFKADLAWVVRGDVAPLDEVYTNPIDVYFNHAIARVEAEGKVYWIDPTNPVAFAGGTYPDIAGRRAWVLSGMMPFFDQIPKMKAAESLYESDLTYRLKSDKSIDVEGKLKYSGRAAIGVTARSFYGTKDNFDYELVKFLSANGRVLDYKVGVYDRASRVVTDLVFPVNFRLADIGLKTSAGFGFPLLRDELIARLTVDERDRESDLLLENPGIQVTRFEIAGAKRVGNISMDCRIESSWVALIRKIKDTGDGVLIEDRIEVKESVVPSEEIRSPSFAQFQTKVRDCYGRAAVILKEK